MFLDWREANKLRVEIRDFEERMGIKDGTPLPTTIVLMLRHLDFLEKRIECLERQR